MTTDSKKRPIGIKAQQKSKKIKKTEQKEESKFKTIALLGTTTKAETEEKQVDGLTFEDLIQLKKQAEELIDNPTGIEGEEEQLVNLLRGICHESIRLIEIAEQQNQPPASIYSTQQLIAWASLELGIFLELNQNYESFVQPDEPNSLDAWLTLAAQVLNKLPSQDPVSNLEENAEVPASSLKEHVDVQSLAHSISLLKATKPVEILETLKILLKEEPLNESEYGCSNYLLRTIDRLILLKSEIISKDPTPIFKIITNFLRNLRGFSSQLEKKEDDNKDDFQHLIDQRLGDCYLTHGTLIVEELEDQYYPEEEDEEKEEGDDQNEEPENWKFDPNCPTYKLSLETLRLAEQTFSKLLVDVDDSYESKDSIKSKLDETLLTIGNLLPPGPEREELYIRAGLNNKE